MKICFFDIEFIFFNSVLRGEVEEGKGTSKAYPLFWQQWLSQQCTYYTTFTKNSKVHQDISNTKLGHQGSSIKDCKENSLSADIRTTALQQLPF